MKEKIIKIIINTIKEYNDGLDSDQRLSSGLDDTIYGEGSNLDSLGLVSFIVGLEQEIEDELGKSVSLADEKAMSQKSNPYKSINNLADYIVHSIS
tara:strand:- start:265 stop:552 length:288 start_codon:yes stop_codon:yes gene_type:complete